MPTLVCVRFRHINSLQLFPFHRKRPSCRRCTTYFSSRTDDLISHRKNERESDRERGSEQVEAWRAFGLRMA